MTQKFLESDEVDSKIFCGRVLTLLGEILSQQNSLRIYLEDAFHVPGTHQRQNHDRPDEEDEEDYPEEDDV